MPKKNDDFYNVIAECSIGELKEVMSNCSEQVRRIGVWPIAVAEIAWIALYNPILQLFVGGLRERRAALFWYDDPYGPLTFDQTIQNTHDINFITDLIDWSPLIAALITALIAGALIAILVHIRRNCWRKRLDSCTKEMELRAAKAAALW